MEFLKLWLAAFIIISVIIGFAWLLTELVFYLVSIGLGWAVLLFIAVAVFSAMIAAEAVNR